MSLGHELGIVRSPQVLALGIVDLPVDLVRVAFVEGTAENEQTRQTKAQNSDASRRAGGGSNVVVGAPSTSFWQTCFNEKWKMQVS